jgi:hypothetical protein
MKKLKNATARMERKLMSKVSAVMKDMNLVMMVFVLVLLDGKLDLKEMVLVSVLKIEPEIVMTHVVVLKLTMMTTTNVFVLNTCKENITTNLMLNNVHALKESKMVFIHIKKKAGFTTTCMVCSTTMLRTIVV